MLPATKENQPGGLGVALYVSVQAKSSDSTLWIFKQLINLHVRWRSWGAERFRNLPKVTQLFSAPAMIWMPNPKPRIWSLDDTGLHPASATCLVYSSRNGNNNIHLTGLQGEKNLRKYENMLKTGNVLWWLLWCLGPSSGSAAPDSSFLANHVHPGRQQMVAQVAVSPQSTVQTWIEFQLWTSTLAQP